MLLLIGAAIAAGLLGGLTDWLVMGVLFHDAYNTYPEVWRPGIAGGQDKGAVILSALIGFVMTAAIVALCVLAGVNGIAGGLGVALLAWIAGPLALTIINSRFIKTDPRLILSHALGYLMRFALAGIAVGLVKSVA
jgi:hypothetical protein